MINNIYTERTCCHYLTSVKNKTLHLNVEYCYLIYKFRYIHFLRNKSFSQSNIPHKYNCVNILNSFVRFSDCYYFRNSHIYIAIYCERHSFRFNIIQFDKRKYTSNTTTTPTTTTYKTCAFQYKFISEFSINLNDTFVKTNFMCIAKKKNKCIYIKRYTQSLRSYTYVWYMCSMNIAHVYTFLMLQYRIVLHLLIVQMHPLLPYFLFRMHIHKSRVFLLIPNAFGSNTIDIYMNVRYSFVFSAPNKSHLNITRHKTRFKFVSVYHAQNLQY